jgi:leader peptidase (prepilin peptidase)/N-methyltransferase
LAWASAVDLDRRILPDVLTLGLVLAGLALALAGGGPGLLEASIGAGLGYGALWGVSALYRRWRGREGLGLGDAKLLAAAGAWLGWHALPFVLLAGSLSALICVGASLLMGRAWARDSELAFGPFLAGGFWLVWTLGRLTGVTA